MSTPAKHIYATLPDEEHKRTPMLKQCIVDGCQRDALIVGLCYECDLQSRQADDWHMRAKRRAEMRASFFASLWDGLRLLGGVSLYLACVVALLWGIWRAM